jgi:hypothetical protein
MFSLTLTLFLTSIHRAFATSQIALFSDTNCEHSLRGLEGPNGYPNGTCTDLRRNGPYGSFQVVGLDPGCAGAWPDIQSSALFTNVTRSSNHLCQRYHHRYMLRPPRRNSNDRLLQLHLRILQYRFLRRWYRQWKPFVICVLVTVLIRLLNCVFFPTSIVWTIDRNNSRSCGWRCRGFRPRDRCHSPLH